MYYQNINKEINEEASKLLVEKTLSIKTNYSANLASYLCLMYKLNQIK